MSMQPLYFVTDELGNHIMTAPLSTLENIFGLTAEQVMTVLREPHKECKIVRQGRRVTDKTIRIRCIVSSITQAPQIAEKRDP